MTELKYLSKDEIDRILKNPLNEEEILIRRKNHLLVNIREQIITGTPEPGTIYL